MDLDILIDTIEYSLVIQRNEAEKEHEDVLYKYRVAAFLYRAAPSTRRPLSQENIENLRTEISNKRNEILDLRKQLEEIRSFRQKMVQDPSLRDGLQKILGDDLEWPRP